MTWYVAHLVMRVEFRGNPPSKSQKQSGVPVWENIILLSANDENEAWRKAEARGNRDAADEDESFSWGGRPAKWVFEGVRKLTECESGEVRPADGDELTWLQHQFATKAQAKRFALGKSAMALHCDPITEDSKDDGTVAAAAQEPTKKRRGA